MRTTIISTVVFVFIAGCTQQAATVKSVDDYRAEAAAAVSAVDVQSVMGRVDDDAVVFVDVREGDEIERLGKIEGAVHVPRGVLEFSIDPGSARHKEIFSSSKRVIFYCATGGRSMLAAKVAKDMGVTDPVYLEGGFRAWSEAGGSVSH